MPMNLVCLRPSAWTVILALLTLGLSPARVDASPEKGLTPLAEPRPAPEFELPGTDGRSHRLEEYRGRFLLVNFWAVWCAPCLKEMPSMQRAYDTLQGERFDLIAIHVGPSLKDAKEFADENHLGFSVLVDESMNLGIWQVLGVPTTYLVGPQGKIVAEAVGEREWDTPQMLEALRGYLSESPP